MIFYIIIAMMAGVTIVVSRIVNAKLSERIGLFESTFYNFLTGLIFSMIILLFAILLVSILAYRLGIESSNTLSIIHDNVL